MEMVESERNPSISMMQRVQRLITRFGS
jgi:hypothetical protein